MFPTLVGDGTDVKKWMADMLVCLHLLAFTMSTVFGVFVTPDMI